jgi:hypothetical protein
VDGNLKRGESQNLGRKSMVLCLFIVQNISEGNVVSINNNNDERKEDIYRINLSWFNVRLRFTQNSNT